jgi:hypothetical protein
MGERNSFMSDLNNNNNAVDFTEVMNEVMWNKLLSLECKYFIRSLESREDDEYKGDSNEYEPDKLSDEAIDRFFKHVKQTVVDYKVLVILATQWFSYSETKQAKLAIHHVGWVHASRFIMLMEYLSMKFLKGELR